MRNFYIGVALLIFSLFSIESNAQVFKLHAEYKSDWYGQGYMMNEDIPGYPSVSLQADSAADQFVIESDNGNNRWRKYGTTGFDTAYPAVWYTLGITDNYFNINTKPLYYYTTRLKNVGYSSTNFCVMETEFAPVSFASSAPVMQVPDVNSVTSSQTVLVTVNLQAAPSLQEKFFIRYSIDNFSSSKIEPVAFIGGSNTTGIATLPSYPSGTTVRYYAFSSTVDATQPTLGNDYDLITLKQCTNQGANFSYTVDPVFSKVTINLNMNNQVVSPNGVYLVGNFNNFDTTATPMVDMGNGYYQSSVTVDTSIFLEYKFLNGNSFLDEEYVPAGCGVANGFGGYNRYLDVPSIDTILDTVCFGKCTNCSASGIVKVKFSLNMSQQTISPNGVHIAASFNNFNPSIDSLTNVGNGIYEAFFQLDSTSVVSYKFINGNSFSDEEIVPSTCGIPDGFGAYNRILDVPEIDTDLDTVCFASCGNCQSQSFMNIEFRVNMSQQTVSPNGVHLAGTFNGFDADSLLLDSIGGGIYSATIALVPGSNIEYKFINGDTFSGVEQVPSGCGIADGFGGYNRKIVVPMAATSLPVVCFSSCVDCFNTMPVDVAFRVNMSNEIVSANGVHLAGSFNNFNPDSTLMNPIGGGIYEAIVSLDTTATVSYKFINGNSFAGVENVPSACGVSDGFGGYNRQLNVPNANDILAPVCFSSCSDCSTPSYVSVLFLVDLTGLTISPNGVHIAGTFNGFSPSASPMLLLGNNIYMASFYLDTTTSIEYKYINGDTFGAGIDEVVPAACGVPNGFGGYNRSLHVPEVSDTLPVVCFSSCTSCIGIGINEMMKQDLNFALVPSVTSENTVVYYSTGTKEKLKLNVFTPEGRLLLSEELLSNEQTTPYELSTSTFNSGIYIVQLSSGKKQIQKKLSIVK